MKIFRDYVGSLGASTACPSDLTAVVDYGSGVGLYARLLKSPVMGIAADGRGTGYCLAASGGTVVSFNVESGGGVAGSLNGLIVAILP